MSIPAIGIHLDKWCDLSTWGRESLQRLEQTHDRVIGHSTSISVHTPVWQTVLAAKRNEQREEICRSFGINKLLVGSMGSISMAQANTSLKQFRQRVENLLHVGCTSSHVRTRDDFGNALHYAVTQNR